MPFFPPRNSFAWTWLFPDTCPLMQGHDGVFFFGDPMFPSLSIGGHVVPLVVLDDRLSDYCGVEIEAHHTRHIMFVLE
jgi:hypothetical protein